MNRKLHWGIAALIVILIAAGGFIYYQWSEVQQLKEQLAQDAKLLEQKRNLLAENNLPPAEPGKKWMPHDDHFHEVPIDVPDVWQDTPHEPSAEPAVKYTGPLTYHKELLETNPVKALRLQSEERGHWSAEHISPFPTDDTEAQEYARNQYLLNYYVSIGMVDTPIYQKVALEYLSQKRAINAQYPVADPVTARQMDLWRLTWTHTDAGEITPYGGMTRYGRARMFLSDYFPDFIDVPE